jgi:hypothetical protein
MNILGAIVLLGLLGLFAWHASWLNQCRNDATGFNPIRWYYFIQSGCPSRGPYGPNDNVLIYAALHPLAGN